MHSTVDFLIEDAIATITINRPDAANALNFAAREALSSCIDRIEADGTIRAVILTAAGSRVFVAGSDIRDMIEMSPAQSVAWSESIVRLNQRISALPRPVICVINGWCLGGGLELALACDIRIAAQDARFGFPEAKLGVMTGAGGAARLVRTVGSGMARHMMLSGEFVEAQRAYEIGLVTQVFPANDLQAAARRMANHFATLGPIALAQIKRTLAAAESADLAAGTAAEIQACSVCFGTEDKHEGMAAFLEKRPPIFRGR